MKMKRSELVRVIKEVIGEEKPVADAASERSELLRKTIEEYIGAPVSSVLHHADPRFPGVFAVRATIEGTPEPEDYVVFGFSTKKTPQEMAKDVSEESFATWPPGSKGA